MFYIIDSDKMKNCVIKNLFFTKNNDYQFFMSEHEKSLHEKEKNLDQPKNVNSTNGN